MIFPQVPIGSRVLTRACSVRQCASMDRRRKTSANVDSGSGAAARLRSILIGLVFTALLLCGHSAHASPFFARTYNMRCTVCHSGVPRLNTFGLEFKANNFRIPGMEKSAPLAWKKTVPLAFKVQPTQMRFTPGAHKAEFTDTQILAGGLLTRTTSFYVHHSLWIDDKPVEFPSYEVWLQQVLSERGRVMLKVGQFELPLAYSPGINRATLFQPLLFGAATHTNDVRLGSAMRGFQLAAQAPKWADAYIAVGAPSVLTPGNTVGEREFLGEFRDVFLRVASPLPDRNVGGFLYVTHPTRDPANPGSRTDGLRFGLEGKVIWKGAQIDLLAIYGEDSNPTGMGQKGVVRGMFLEGDKMIRPWVGVTGRFETQTISAAKNVYSNAWTAGIRFYPVSGQRYLRLQAEYQQMDHGRTATALQATVNF